MNRINANSRTGILVVLIALLLVGLNGCSSPLMDKSSSVRFQNMTDFNLYYGIKFGDAEYIGPVSSGFTTGYITTAAGTYSLQALNASSQWVTISTGSMTISGGHKYTIVGTGTSGYYYWAVVQDS